MKLLLLGIVIELVGVNFGLIGVILGGPIYRDIVHYAAVLGIIFAILGFFFPAKKDR